MSDLIFDTETTGLNTWYGLAEKPGKYDAEPPARPFLLQTASDAHPDGTDFRLDLAGGSDSAAHRAAKGWKNARWVAHNLPFDVHQLWSIGVDLLDGRRLADTDTLARLAWPDRRWPDEDAIDRATHGYKLKDLALDYLDPDAKDGEAELERLAELHGFKLKAKPGSPDYRSEAYYRLWQFEPDAMEFYAREDVRLTRLLLRAGEARLTERSRKVWELEQQVHPILIRAERTGICVNQEAVGPLRAQYKREAEAARIQLDTELMDGWDDNNELLAEALIKHGVPLTETTDSGQIAVNKGALDKHLDTHPIIQQLYDYRTSEKFVSTYLDHMDYPVIHPTFWQIGTWTGRMAGSNPNLQNVPVHAGTAIRELYVPREGMAFAAIDFEQIELRLLAYYLHVREIQDRVTGSDFFAWVASQVYGGDEAMYRKGAEHAALRQVCKNATYAIVYGAGGLKVGRMVGWPPDSIFTENDWVVKRGYKKAGEPRCKRAEQLVKQIKSILRGYGAPAYPNRSGWGLMGKITEQVAVTGYVNTLMGRPQYLGLDGGWKGLSGLIQGGAADAFKRALVEATPVAAELGGYPLLFIHDEIVFEFPVDSVEEGLRRCGQAMSDCLKDDPGDYGWLETALAVEGGIGYKNWGECK